MPRGDSLARASAAELDVPALRAYEATRREAFSGLVVITVVLSGIWYVVTGAGFYWPIFVVLAAGANLLRVLHKRDIVEPERRHPERRRPERLEAPGDT